MVWMTSTCNGVFLDSSIGTFTQVVDLRCFFYHWKYQVCVRSAGAAFELLQWQQSVSAPSARGQETALSILHSSRQRDSSLFGLLWKAHLSPASDVLRLDAKSVTGGAFAQCLCPLPESYREAESCSVTWKKTAGKPNLSPPPHLQHRVERSSSQGSSVYPAVDTNWSG